MVAEDAGVVAWTTAPSLLLLDPVADAIVEKRPISKKLSSIEVNPKVAKNLYYYF